ncbi:MAG: hypothetical protein ACK5PB_12530 [Pirellula sp.]|jgi:hypothetical protein
MTQIKSCVNRFSFAFVLLFFGLGFWTLEKRGYRELSEDESMKLVGGQGPAGGWGPWLTPGQCELVNSDCMGPAYSCEQRSQQACTGVGVYLMGGPSEGCRGLEALGNSSCRESNATASVPCASYLNCKWFGAVGGCSITLQGPAPNPLAVYAPAACQNAP